MRSLLVSLCMLLVIAQTFSKWLVILDYRLNKDLIAKTLCVNRTKPAMHCNGKCFLKKQLNKTEKDEDSNTTAVKSIEETVYVSIAYTSDVPVHIAALYHHHPPFKKDHYRYNCPTGCFHPPCII